MSTDTIEDLLHEVADAVEPEDRLDAIRAATAAGGRRTHPGWWAAAGGVGLVAASVVTALALGTATTPRSDDLGPASSGPTSPSSSPGTATEQVVPSHYGPVDVYLVADTPRGPRLYRELRPVESNQVDERLADAIAAAVGRSPDGSSRPPLDPDYRVPWPAGTFGTATFDESTDEITIDVLNTEGSSVSLRDRGTLSEEEASVAVEALIRTSQAIVAHEAPVRFRIDGEPTDQLLGVATAEPLAAGSDVDVLAGVSLSEPSEGHEMREGKGVKIDGVGLVDGAEVSLRVRRDGGPVVIAATLDLEADGTTLPSFSTSWFNDDLTPGTYLVSVSVTNADGTVDTDTRGITVVD